MNPSATQRFRGLTAALAVAWAASSFILALGPLFGAQDVCLPFRFSGVAGALRVQEPTAAASSAGVRVDHPEGFVFLLEIVNQLHQQQVFEYVGVIAGVEGVAVAEHRVRLDRQRKA